jgi:hypothetical protein
VFYSPDSLLSITSETTTETNQANLDVESWEDPTIHEIQRMKPRGDRCHLPQRISSVPDYKISAFIQHLHVDYR